MSHHCAHGIIKACSKCFEEKLEKANARIEKLEGALRDIRGFQYMQKEEEFRHYLQVDIPSLCEEALNGSN